MKWNSCQFKLADCNPHSFSNNKNSKKKKKKKNDEISAYATRRGYEYS